MALQFRLTTPIIEDLTLEMKPEQMAGPESSEIRATCFPAEWFPQDGVQLTWPHEHTDWAPMLEEVTACYIRMALEISLRERLIIVSPNTHALWKLLAERLPQRAMSNISLYEIDSNDTWARDHGLLTLTTNMGTRVLDFQFNGWGKKFPAELDNQICRKMMEAGIFESQYEDHLDFVLEGGSVESDGRGTILTTSHCLMAHQRNQPLTQQEIEERLKLWLQAERILWLDHGWLAGDDTDGHIDTLARFCPNDTIAYVKCDNTEDEHYEALHNMEMQLQGFHTLEGEHYRLIPLPMPQAMYDDEGGRLPATYANFLCVNGAVLMPTYGDTDADGKAHRQLQTAFPRHEIVDVDCRILVVQHGSLHCSTMQFPKGTLKLDREHPQKNNKT